MTACVRAGVISAQDAEVVAIAQATRREVIRVDDFSADYWRGSRVK